MTFKEFLNSEKSKSPHFLLIGEPVSHSVSPIMHNTALKYHGIDAEYHAISVSIFDFDSLAVHFNSPMFLGSNVTLPHKGNIIPLVDELSEVANRIGAVNTLLKSEGRLIGENTDAYGFKVPLEEKKGSFDTDRAIIFGTGGATKAILDALNDLGFDEVCMVSRKKAVYPDDPNLILCNYDSWIEYAEDASLIINATPLGMIPNVDASPVQGHEIGILEGKICYDVVYNPRETKFLKQAENAGGIPIGGLEMLIHQGALSFKKWTKREFPIGLIQTKLDEIF